MEFKLVAGLGNKDVNRVVALVLPWLKAGAGIFDTSAKVLPALQKEIVKNGYKLNDYEFCVSVPVSGDVHGKKALILQNLCKKCGKCAKKCKEGAIEKKENEILICQDKCIGCMHCKKVCDFNAIEFGDDMNSDFDELLETDAKIDTLEVHISTKDKKEIINFYEKIVKKIRGRINKISVCLSRTYFSNKKTEKILAKLKELSNGFVFVVQTDGMPMNGGKEDFASTIEAVAFGVFVKSLGYDVILSGGTNSHTAPLAKSSGLDCTIAYGSYARNLISGLNTKEAFEAAREFILKTTKC